MDRRSIHWKNFIWNNQLKTLPEGIGGLSQSKKLYLRFNQITTLPHSVQSLQNIILLDLSDNPLVEYGEGDTLGWRELRDRFGDRVVISQDYIRGPKRKISEDEVYEKLAACPPLECREAQRNCH